MEKLSNSELYELIGMFADNVQALEIGYFKNGFAEFHKHYASFMNNLVSIQIDHEMTEQVIHAFLMCSILTSLLGIEHSKVLALHTKREWTTKSYSYRKFGRTKIYGNDQTGLI